MDGFQLYVTNTLTIPPVGYLCYKDEFTWKPPFQNITQTIPCHTLGKYVIYYDDTASDEINTIILPVVELCYVAINGCQKTFWGTSCDISCPESCLEQHCYPGNGSCIFGGCSNSNCLKSNCDRDTEVCIEGCRTERTGSYCDKYNLASDSSILFNSNGNEHPSLATDGNIKSCVTTSGADVLVQVDLKEMCIVAEIYITVIVNTTKDGNHIIYASNNSDLWKSGIVLYNNESSPTVISVNAVFRYLTYIYYIQNQFLELRVCEIGIVGEFLKK
ncbi:Hypothetical predicted protein [Mytilus galloprovincialis]|uniref:Fucolectin tachylectin-4 pentraxin-1 domain-containing protein n=1 Tax=Mytilus galloprovincialis TaxID=29158 RepID=A0A8B6EFD9_MYTGA|nr:Hypothetical predicted protein [Mytilus galloprovincialis]